MFTRGCSLTVRRVVFRSSRSGRSASDFGDSFRGGFSAECGRVLHADVALETTSADREPHYAASEYGCRGRRAKRPVFPQFRAGLWGAKDSEQVLHGVRAVQAMPRGYLQPVVQFDTPLLFIQ